MDLMILSGNTLKIIAAIFMLIDHIGLILLPNQIILRIIGRLSFPIFAFMIAEGCVHTKNKAKYFSGIFTLATICQTFYYVYNRNLYMGILITFSISILLIYLLEFLKERFFLAESTGFQKLGAALIFTVAIVAVYGLNIYGVIDYGFWGCIAPLFATVCNRIKAVGVSSLTLQKIMFVIALLILSTGFGGIQYYCLLAMPLLFAYSGKRGKAKMKLFFYIFYPAHLVAVQLVSLLFN